MNIDIKDGILTIESDAVNHVTINGRQFDINGNLLPLQDAKYITALRTIDAMLIRKRGYTKKTSAAIIKTVREVLA